MEINEQQVRASVRLVATNSLWVAGFQGLFGDPCGVEIVAVSLEKALGLKHPEAVLIDSGEFRAPGALREVLGRFRQTCPHISPIVIGSDYAVENVSGIGPDNLYIQRLIQAGAKGFLSPSARPDELSAALNWVRSGSIWAPRQVLSRLVQSSQFIRSYPDGSHGNDEFSGNRLGGAEARFTPREEQVLRLLIGGKCNREIGEALGVGPDMVKAHLGRIMRKAGVANRIELTMFALSAHDSPARKVKSRTVIPIDALCVARETRIDAPLRRSKSVLPWVN